MSIPARVIKKSRDIHYMPRLGVLRLYFTQPLAVFVRQTKSHVLNAIDEQA